MTSRDGTMAVLGTVLVAALAVGVAIGAHTLTGTAKADPSASPDASTSTSTSGDFCGLMNQLMALGVDGNAPFAPIASVLDTNDSPPLDAVHAEGKKLADFAKGGVAIVDRAAKIVDDPAMASAFGDSAKGFDFLGTVGAKERDAVSVDALFGDVMALALDPNTAKINDAADVANATITEYVIAKCGIDLGGASSSATATPDPTATATTTMTWGEDVDPATAAKQDATAIGQDLTEIFAAWNAGDSLPTVDYNGGYYTIEGAAASYMFAGTTTNAAIADEFITGPTDWCVSVEVTGSPSATWNYSSSFGLTEGTCA